MKTLIESQLGYCPLVWIFHGNRTLNNIMNNIQERTLRLVYTDYDQLSAKDRSYRIHHRNLQRLAIEIYKFKDKLGPKILHDMFEASSNIYNTRSDKILNTRNVKSVFNGTETVSCRVQQTWGIVPGNIKIASSSKEFISRIKKWHLCNVIHWVC